MTTEPKEAPGELALVRAFVNTLDLEGGSDDLAGPAELSAWFVAHRLLEADAAADEADAARAVALREALRALLLSNNDGRTVDRSTPVALEEVAARAALRLRVAPDGAVSLGTATPGVDGALGRLLLIVYRAMEDGTWARLKACRNDSCHWAFYDHSKNRSGHWCTMSVCGNRTKARQYRQRHKPVPRRASGRASRVTDRDG